MRALMDGLPPILAHQLEKIMTKFYDNLEKELHAIVAPCVEKHTKAIWERAKAGIFTSAYLYFKKSGPGMSGELCFVFDGDAAPSGFELAHPQALRCDVPVSNYYTWTRSKIGRLPILAY